MAETPTNTRNRDAGLALVLILLLTAWFLKNLAILPLAIVFLVFAMSLPSIFKPFTLIWFGFSNLLGTISSRIILTLLFFLVVTPIGLIRRMFGADPLQMSPKKYNRESAFKNTDHQYQKKDMIHPY